MNPEFGQWRYEGTWQTPIPNALISDKRLSPSALKLWIVLRVAIAPGQALSPTYDYLVAQCNLSRSTVARCVKLLRALRWIQTKQVTSESGWLAGSMYRMFDAPQAIEEIARLDAEYPAFLAQCAGSLDTGLRTMALIEIDAWHAAGLADIALGSSKIKLGSSKTRLPSSKTELPEKTEISGSSKTELPGSMKFELLEKARISGSSEIELPRTRDVVSSCSTTTLQEVSMETRAREALIWPDVIPLDVRQKASARLGALSEGMAQEIVDEVQYRYQSGKASNPVSLLFGLIPIAEQGKFQITGGMNVAKARARQSAPTLAQAQPEKTREQERLEAQAAFEQCPLRSMRELAVST
jgi:hypothetical protein